jgi:hypothetical protein
MRVDRHRRFAKRRVEHHISGLATNPGQAFKCLPVTRHNASMLFDQDPASFNQVTCLAAK